MTIDNYLKYELTFSDVRRLHAAHRKLQELQAPAFCENIQRYTVPESYQAEFIRHLQRVQEINNEFVKIATEKHPIPGLVYILVG